MKKFLIVLLALAVPAFGQITPEDPSIVLIGPVMDGKEVGLSVGYAKQIAGIYLVGFGKFGKTVETEGEIVKLFKLSSKLYVGPVAAAGVDWSEEPGTGGAPTSAYLFGAAGMAATYTISDHFGAWGFGKRYMNDNVNKYTAGVGLYYSP